VGLSVMATAALYGAAQIVAIDLDDKRLDLARQVGATHSVNSGASDWKEQVFALTDGYGVDVAVEAVGVPATFDMCTHLVRPGGNVANVGVHGKAAMLDLQRLWIQNINISMGLVNTTTLGMLLKLVKHEMLPVDNFVTHSVRLRRHHQCLRDIGERSANWGAQGAHKPLTNPLIGCFPGWHANPLLSRGFVALVVGCSIYLRTRRYGSTQALYGPGVARSYWWSRRQDQTQAQPVLMTWHLNRNPDPRTVSPQGQTAR
jgi:hypothetical protein